MKFYRMTVFLGSDLSKFNVAKERLDLKEIPYKTKVSNDDKMTVMPQQGSYRGFGGNITKYGNPVPLYEILVRNEDFEEAKKIISGV